MPHTGGKTMLIKVLLVTLLVLLVMSNGAWFVVYRVMAHSLKQETVWRHDVEQQRDFWQKQDEFLFPYYVECQKAKSGK
jgi:hypothetical protein